MTLLLSRSQPELTTCHATILHCAADEKGRYFTVDQTVFYPQGGGQMSDNGSVTQGDRRFAVKQALSHGDEVRHYLADAHGVLVEGESVVLDIDAAFRLLASRAHTAGHLISNVVETLMPSLIPAKGHHFLPGAYVEFSGNSTISAEQLFEQVKKGVQDAIENNLAVSTRSVSFDEIARLRPALAGGIPQQDDIRIVQIGEYLPFACGGTHAATTAALQGLELRKIKAKERVKISYELS